LKFCYDKSNFTSNVVTANTAIYPKWTRTNPETFAEADRPELVLYDEGQTYYYGIRLPWNYNKPYNSTRKYPLPAAKRIPYISGYLNCMIIHTKGIVSDGEHQGIK
jgi:hypothetical protein